MITPVLIPQVTLTMEGGTIVRWLKKEGDRVEKEDVLFELETDKALVEVASPSSGLIKKIVIREGTVAVGTTVAFIGEPSDAIPEITPVWAPRTGFTAPVAQSAGAQTPEAADIEPGMVRATPAARRRAKELGVELVRARGTGPEGRITQEDVERAVEQHAVTPPGPDLRRAIGDRMTNAWHTVPHIHIGGELSAAGLKAALHKSKERIGAGVSLTDLLLFAVAPLLGDFPVLNSVWREGRAEPQFQVHLAFAVQTDRGVVAPVICDADRLSLREISIERRRLTDTAMSRRLKLAEVEGGTFTLTNLGMYPVDFFVPIINYPQSAILATGRLRETAEIRNGTASPVPRIWVNLAVDHRVADGAVAAEFLQELEKVFSLIEQRI